MMWSDDVVSRLFDRPMVGDQWLATIVLSEDEWRRLLPTLSPEARAIIVARDDLSPEITRMSVTLGSTRLALPAPIKTAPADQPLDPAIAEGRRRVQGLLARITELKASVQAQDEAAAVDGWQWECDQRGIIVDVGEGGPASLVGRPLLDFATYDAPFTTALRRRAPFRDFQIIATDTPAKNWLLAGVPVFHAWDGRFLGFRGMAEVMTSAAQPAATQPTGGLFGTGASSDTLSQMAHEVRSPLNAIMGFAQMIEGEVLGPAGEIYRQRAIAIMTNAKQLLSALDDLTDAAKLDQGFYMVEHRPFDIGVLVEQVVERYQPLAQENRAIIATTIAAGLPLIWGDRHSTERALNRLIAAVLACARSGETLLLGAQPAAGDHVRIFVSRPARLAGLSVEALLDPTSGLEREGVPILGLGFGLRLVRQLGAVLGGRFEVEPHLFTLTLPPFTQGATVQGARPEKPKASS